MNVDDIPIFIPIKPVKQIDRLRFYIRSRGVISPVDV